MVLNNKFNTTNGHVDRLIYASVVCTCLKGVVLTLDLTYGIS